MATKKGGGAKTTRSETVTVRLDPELRYLAEIAARAQRRTLSSYIEWAIQDSLARVPVDSADGPSVADVARRLWDVDEADKFAKLAFHAPHLLNYDEQRLWKLVREYGPVWDGWWEGEGDNSPEQYYTWHIQEQSLKWETLRDCWPMLVAAAAGDEDAQRVLSQWKKVRDNPDHVPF